MKIKKYRKRVNLSYYNKRIIDLSERISKSFNRI